VVEPLFYAALSECDLAQAETELIAEYDCAGSGYNANSHGHTPTTRTNVPTHTFMLRVEPEQAKRIDEFRWSSRQTSPSAAMRKIVELGLEAAERQTRAA
jgi:hypothetical protein